MGIRESVANEIEKLGETVTVYNSVQTTDDDTAYESVVTDDYVDGGNAGTEEIAVIQPAGQSRDQLEEGRLLAGDLFVVFKWDSIITNNSLVVISNTSREYKVKKIDDLRPMGETTHFEVLLEFVREL